MATSPRAPGYGHGSPSATSPASTSSPSAIPRPSSLAPRKSNANLRASQQQIPRAHTPEPPAGHTRYTPSPVTPTPTPAGARLAPRTIGSSARPSLGPGPTTPRNTTTSGTPRSRPSIGYGKSVDSAANVLTPPPPVPHLDPSKYDAGQLSLDDLGTMMQVKDGNEAGYKGILRYLGQIQGKGKVSFAGIELVDQWEGKGKNDGIVAGLQYFATSSNNGMFLAPSRLQRVAQTSSSSSARDAVARPQSAMSGRSSSAAHHHDTDGSTARQDVFQHRTPAAQRTTTAAAVTSARPSLTGRPSSSLASHRSSSRAGQAPATTPARPRMSMTSPTRSSTHSTSASSSPLKDALTNASTTTPRIPRASIGGTPGLPKARKSFAPATPARGAATRSPVVDMHPPPLPTGGHSRTVSETNQQQTPSRSASVMSHRSSSSTHSHHSRPASALSTSSRRVLNTTTPSRPGTSLSRHASGAATPSRPSTSLSRHASSHHSISRPTSALETGREEEESEGKSGLTRSMKARSLALLEQMDLNGLQSGDSADTDATPKKGARSSGINGTSTTLRSPSRPSSSTSSSAAVGEPVVPLSTYEDLHADLSRKEARVRQLEQQLEEASQQRDRQESSALDRERRRLREETQSHLNLLEEERALEKEDEKRRRGEIESREKAAKNELEQVKKDLKRAQEESGKKDGEASTARQELETHLDENETLIKQLKDTIAEHQSVTSVNAEAASNLAVKDAEIQQFKNRVERLESQIESERKELTQEIEDLKEAGQETISLYELRLEEAAEESRLAMDDLEDKMRQLQQRAQEAIATAEKERDDSRKPDHGGATSAAAAIDLESLQDSLSHAQNRLASTEDELSELQSVLDSEREASSRRKERLTEAENRHKSEIKKLKTEMTSLQGELTECKEKMEELHEALEERGAALESERAELEVLRAEAENANEEKSTDSSHSSHTATIARLTTEVDRLTSLLEGARSGKREVQRQYDDLKRKMDRLSVGTMSSPRVSLEDQESMKRFSSSSSSTGRKSFTSSTTGGEDSSQQRELTGLRSIVESLSSENALLRGQIRKSSSSTTADERVKELEMKLKQLEETKNKEVADLEALVENNMWIKEELEGKLRKLTSQDPKRVSSQTSGTSASEVDGDTEACDDCGSKEHTLENCPLLNEIF
ncbi:unnamed protein product [Sympodiomycopsis kandeliae]